MPWSSRRGTALRRTDGDGDGDGANGAPVDCAVPVDGPAGAGVPGPRDERQDGSSAVVAGAMRGLFGRDSLYVGLTLLQVVGAAAATPLITRVLDAEQFGGTASANAVMQVLFILGSAGLGVAIQRSFAGPNGPTSAATMLGLGVVIGLLVGVVAGSSAPLWGPAVGFADQRLLVVLAASWAGLGAITGCSLALLRSQDRIGPYAAVGLLQSVVAEFLSLGLVLLVAPTAEAFVWGQVIAQAAACLLGLVLAPPGLPRWRDRDLLREGLALGIPLVPAMLGGFVLNAADRLMINGQLGEEAVGRYQVAYNIGALPELVIGLLTSVWMPRFFAVADDHRDAVLDASRDALYRLLCPVMIGMAVAAPILLRLWAPAEYRTDELVLLTTVIVVMAVPYTAAMAATRVLLTRSDTRVIAYAAMVAAVSNVVLNLLLIPVWGLMGSAVATVAGFSVQHLVLLSRVGRRASRAPLHRRPWLYVLVGCAAAFATVPLPLGADGSVFRMVLAVLCLGWFGWELRRTAMGAEPAAAATRG